MAVIQNKSKITPELEAKHFSYFSSTAVYKNNGIYEIAGLYSTDTRELFLMYVSMMEFQEHFD